MDTAELPRLKCIDGHDAPYVMVTGGYCPSCYDTLTEQRVTFQGIDYYCPFLDCRDCIRLGYVCRFCGHHPVLLNVEALDG